MENLNTYLDLANHHQNATEEDVRTVCQNVVRYKLNAAFVNPHYVELARELLGGNGKVGTVVSFPLGQETLALKQASARAALTSGVDELDISLNVAYIKEGKWQESLLEMKTIVQAVREISSGKIVKFIPETGFLTSDEIKKVAELILESGADFFKTTSGMGPRGATIEDVRTVREAVGEKLKIKVAGGIDSFAEAVAFIEAGANRIGSSKAVEIITKATSSGGGKGE